jgi:hypothetical protein
VGAYRIMRDPCLAEGPDGTFHMVWTSGWTADKGKTIAYAPRILGKAKFACAQVPNICNMPAKG